MIAVVVQVVLVVAIVVVVVVVFAAVVVVAVSAVVVAAGALCSPQGVRRPCLSCADQPFGREVPPHTLIQCLCESA